ncbi:restriction endonuclease subunit S [Helicobacter pylori]|uniref:restriction endonuclease subunit S n=1 Tax=Helicobacter pylori TaxID=210 RepID=UPI00041C4095|nr:restriction endonuclease subunit S [Helicobacter pylori]
MDALITPLNWQRVRLGDILELLTDYHANGSYELLKNNVTLLKHVDFAIMIRTTNFENNDFKNDLIYINKKAYEFLSKSKVFAGDILVNKIANAGTAYFMPKLNQPVSLGMNLFLLRIKPNYNNFFIFKQIANYERILKTFANGSATKTITKNVIKNLLIPLPPLNEQIAIANILSALDRYLHALDSLILKKESVKKALSFELLSQRKRLKGFNQAWQKVRLGDILSYEQPTKYLVATTQYLQKGFTPILTAGKTFILGYTNDKHGIYTNIPVIIFDDFTTDSKMVNFPFKVKSSAIKILSLRDNNQADLKYIYEKLTLLKHQVTDHKRYWIDEFSNFEIPLPPLNEQIAIADILSALDKEIASLKNKKRQFENIKKALNHDLMSAKIRVLKK